MTDITFTTVGSRQKRLVDMGDETFAEITALPMLMPTAWVPSSTFNGRVYPDIEIQMIGTPTTAYVFQDSCFLPARQGAGATVLIRAGS